MYSSFFRTRNVVPHFDPYLLARDRNDIKFYRGIDFGVSHPTACVWLAQDLDDNIYIFDEMKDSAFRDASFFDQRSYGMSDDYMLAVEEGSRILVPGASVAPASIPPESIPPGPWRGSAQSAGSGSPTRSSRCWNAPSRRAERP